MTPQQRDHIKHLANEIADAAVALKGAEASFFRAKQKLEVYLNELEQTLVPRPLDN